MLSYTCVNNDILFKLNDSYRDRRKCGCYVIMEFLKKLTKRTETSIMSFFSDISEQSAIPVVISHLNTFKHYVEAELCYSNLLNRTNFSLDVILTSFLKSPEVPWLAKRLVLMCLVSKEHPRGFWYPHIL